MAGQGLVAFRNNAEIDAMNAAANPPPPEPTDDNSHLVDALSAYIKGCYENARNSRNEIEHRLLNCAYRRDGRYDDAKLNQIKAEGLPEVYMMLTAAKSSAAESWINDVMFQPGERPFDIDPTPIPEPPPAVESAIAGIAAQELEAAVAMGLYVSPREVYERQRAEIDMIKQRVKEEAAIRAERMEDVLDDLLTEGGFYDALRETIANLTVYPAAILKGPVFVQKPKLSWVQGQMGEWQAVMQKEVVPTWFSVHLKNLLWSADSRNLNDGFLIELVPLRPHELHAMKSVDGYDAKRIDAALAEYRKGYTLNKTNEQQWRIVEGQTNWDLSNAKPIETLEFRGRVPAELLIQWGMPAERFQDPQEDFEITALQVGRFVVKVVLNEDESGQRPYSIAWYDRVPGQILGRALPEKMADSQDMCNAAVRSMAVNLGIASGPQMEIEVDRLAEGEKITQVRPLRIWQTKSAKTGTGSPAVRFFQPDPIVDTLMKVFEFFMAQADEQTGVPRYQQGFNEGVAKTAAGMSMQMNASARQVKRIIASCDDMIASAVQRLYQFVMKSPGNDDAKCDACVVAKGAASLLIKEQIVARRNEFLAATANPIDMAIIGPEGRAEVLRESVKALEVDSSKVVPNREELIQRGAAMQRATMAMQGAGPAGLTAGMQPAGPQPPVPGEQVAPGGVAAGPAGGPAAPIPQEEQMGPPQGAQQGSPMQLNLTLPGQQAAPPPVSYRVVRGPDGNATIEPVADPAQGGIQ